MWKALIQNVRGFAADLTRKRVRGHAVLLGVVLWGAYAINIATPGIKDREGQLKGADFLHFYVLGNIARMHDASLLYDAPRQAALGAKLIHGDPGETYLPVYGPQYSLVFSPLAALPYGWAAAVWMLGSALVYLLCCTLIVKVCPRVREDRTSILILAAAFPGFFYMVASGQNSILALVAFTTAFFCFRAKLPLLAGMALGVLMYKPQFGVMAAALFVLTLEWRVIAGALITGVGQLIAAASYYGNGALDAYFAQLKRINQSASALEPHLDRMHSLRAFWQQLLPWNGIAFAIYALCAIFVIAITVWCWRSRAPIELRYAVFVLGSVLVDPHLTDYDLVMLMPALLVIGDRILLAEESAQRDAARVLMYLAYVLPLFGPMLKMLHIQLSVPAYVALFLVVASIIRGELVTDDLRKAAIVSSVQA
ncbi:MAG TPA: glycosyltransferase family 87 protein [Terracidiphilus sp.]|nr:glycosyltransferase family 87 protein [Terracidiphilus sp.]